MTDQFQPGDRVACRLPGSWVDGKEGVIVQLSVRSSDGVWGHMIQVDRGVTVVEPECLERAES